MDQNPSAVYADICELLSGIVFETDPDLRISKAAGSFEQTGLRHLDPLPGRSILEIVGMMTDLQARHILARKLKGHETVARLRCHMIADGESVCYEFSALPRAGNSGFSGYRGVIMDVTEAEQIEAEALAARQTAEMANRAKSEFLSSMSHELRTPLNAIIGFSEIIKGELLGPVGDPRYVEYADDILVSGRNLLGLINDILEISRLETRKTELREDEVDVVDVVDSCVRHYQPQFDSKGLDVSLSLPDDLPNLWGDRNAVRQILVQLLSNSHKFVDDGGSIKVVADRLSNGGMSVVVIDNGIGIPEEHLDTVLVPFVQSDGSFARKHGGSGLGLPIAMALMKLHGGRIEIDSEVGKGTRVSLLFPEERVIGGVVDSTLEVG